MSWKYLIVLLFFSSIKAQESNVFVERNYWKTNPSIEKIENELSNGNDISELNKHGFDAVTWAILEKASNKTIQYLITKDGNDVNKLTHDGRTYIFWAAYKNNLELMTYLVSKKAKINIIDEHGYSLINFAATTGQTNLEIYNLCIENGADLTTQKNNDGATPILLLAPFIKKVETLDFFTKRGLHLNDVDSNGNNLFTYASKTGNELMMNHALKNGINPNINNGMAMIFASHGTRNYQNNIQVFKYLDSVGVSFKGTTKLNENVLHILSKKNKDTSLLNYLIANEVDINQEDYNGNTPLTNAIKYNNSELIKFLNNKNTNRIDKNGNTLYHHASQKAEIDIIKTITNTKTDINHKNNDGNTALHLAAMKSKDDKVLKYLIKIGANKDLLTLFNETAYDLARENELLMSLKINIDFLK